MIAVVRVTAELQSRLEEPGEYSLSRLVPLEEIVSSHISKATTESDPLEGNISKGEVDGLAPMGVKPPSLLWLNASELELVRELLGATPNR